MNGDDKSIVWLSDFIKTPPFSVSARIEAGMLLRRLQRGESLGMPNSRPMPSIGKRCHELRIRDEAHNWRIVYRIDDDAIIVVELFPKKTEATPLAIVKRCQRRLANYDAVDEA